MTKKTKPEKALREQLEEKDTQIEKLKNDNIALLKSALKQSKMSRELREGMKKLADINKKLTSKLKKK
ncbi:hypothetical protein KY360_01240 [Candidatus Woesearchaeota archaeon]|nr:hypothetical protein [Candidatus Woesearchaeota archaeon]